MKIRTGFVLAALLLFSSGSLWGQADYKRYYDEDNIPKAREIFERGRYDIVIQFTDYALRRGQPSWEWRTLRFQALANLGRYEEAVEEAVATTESFPGSLGALLEAHELFSSMGLTEKAKGIFEKINAAAAAVPQKERDAEDYVYLGRAALILGADPSIVLKQYFDVAKGFEAKGQIIPEGLVEAYLASGELALEKDDYARASKEFQGAYKLEPTNPAVLFGLARSLLPSDRQAGMEYIGQVLAEVPLHFGALLIQTEHAINFEKFEEAKQVLELVEALNPRLPQAAAFRAVLAEVELNDREAFNRYRDKALSVWKNNPEIDHLIGRVLSRKYRYEEGAESQKRALAMDPDFLPAKLQLALDYLRLGRIEEAWPLAKEVAAADEYNVLAFNLEVLQKEIESFAAIESEDFIIRMPPEEAEIYGDRVLEILTEADEVLGKKYGLEIEEPTLVEFYPNQQDFAIRSFGSLGGEGLLGVCFGSVVTMNSPGSVTAGKNNWEATLWHEYCHVITLTATNNKMPRWLSEGISVYEEIQKEPNWGQKMSPNYRKMILEGEALTPVSEMSQAFFQAKSGQDIMFAYYQSMLIVEFLVENYGLDALRAILKDLGDGVLINDAIAKHTTPMPELEIAFAEFAFGLAENYGPGVDWTEPSEEEVNPLSPIAVQLYLKRNPKNFWARQTHTYRLLDQRSWRAAAESAEELIGLLPDFTGSGNGYALQARAWREMGEPENEIAVLERLAERSAEAYTAYSRLMEVEFEEEVWDGVVSNAKRGKAINPFYERFHYCRGCAHQARNEVGMAVTSFEKTLKLDPVNPSEVRYRLASLHQEEKPETARRYILDALADSPRYREAFSLLMDLSGEEPEAEENPEPEPAAEKGILKKVMEDPFGGGGNPDAPEVGENEGKPKPKPASEGQGAE
ncbi:MAG: peptidase MA family metallohydrolase [Verrucomicrobiales bacterium]|nr:peptidase MA family metallohydrolase [Verrucomicrobiales bacterium]